jgi:hypothetical protein
MTARFTSDLRNRLMAALRPLFERQVNRQSDFECWAPPSHEKTEAAMASASMPAMWIV